MNTRPLVFRLQFQCVQVTGTPENKERMLACDAVQTFMSVNLSRTDPVHFCVILVVFMTA